MQGLWMSHGVRQDSSSFSRLEVSVLDIYQKISPGPLRVSKAPKVIRESPASYGETGCLDHERIPREVRPRELQRFTSGLSSAGWPAEHARHSGAASAQPHPHPQLQWDGPQHSESSWQPGAAQAPVQQGSPFVLAQQGDADTHHHAVSLPAAFSEAAPDQDGGTQAAGVIEAPAWPSQVQL